MQEKKWIGRDAAVLCRQENGELILEGLEGREGEVIVPAQIDGKPVVGVHKKAFFNCRFLRSLILPETVRQLGDWAFAHCPQLAYVQLPQRQLELGKGLFLGSGRLEQIELMPPAQENGERECSICRRQEIAALLAASVTMLDAEYLFVPAEVGTTEWLQKWDNRMLVVLGRSDREGFTRQVLCGEEDYGSTDLGLYEKARRKEKVRLAFLRLLNPCGLKEGTREGLEAYLRGHSKGGQTEEAWEVIREEFAGDRRYYELFARIGCVTEENFDGLLLDVKQESPELKAFLMRYKEETLGYQDFFGGLSLDG